jgi:hypothetical protein
LEDTVLTAASVPADQVEVMGGNLPDRSARASHAFKVVLPSFFELPEIVAMFDRAFTGENSRFGLEPNSLRFYLRDHISDPGEIGPPKIDHWINFWVALNADEKFCGFLVMSYSPWPMSPDLAAVHFFAESPGARRVLLDTSLRWAVGEGFETVAFVNQTGASDRAYARGARPYGKITSLGTMMRCKLDPNL